MVLKTARQRVTAKASKERARNAVLVLVEWTILAAAVTAAVLVRGTEQACAALAGIIGIALVGRRVQRWGSPDRAAEDSARGPRQYPGDDRWDPAVFSPLPADRYAAWLRSYIDAGGQVTHGYDYAYPARKFLLAERDFTTSGQFGSSSREILVPPGTRYLGGDLGHCDLLFEGDGETRPRARCARGAPFVAIYSGPEFSGIAGYEAIMREARAHRGSWRIPARPQRRLQDPEAEPGDEDLAAGM